MLYSYLTSLSLSLFNSYFLQVIFRLSFIFTTSFLITYLGIKFFISFVHNKNNLYQPIRADGPQSHLNEKQIDELVMRTLNDLGLTQTKNLKVGSPLQKTISGGQRKRLNIGLELLREPAVLFCDEPTSGLSSRDSENIIDLLISFKSKTNTLIFLTHKEKKAIRSITNEAKVLFETEEKICREYLKEDFIHFQMIIDNNATLSRDEKGLYLNFIEADN